MSNAEGTSPTPYRATRQNAVIRRDAADASQLGMRYESLPREIDALDLSGVPREELNRLEADLVTSIRELIACRGDVKDPGSVDGSVIEVLGYDVCTNPDLISIIIDKARALYADEDGEVRFEDIIRAKEIFEIEQLDYKHDIKAGFTLIDHGVAEEEVRGLIETDPKRMRSVARLLQEPILGRFSQEVTRLVSESGSKFTFYEIAVRALRLASAYNQHIADLEAGDITAIKLQQELLRLPQMQVALGELLLSQEHREDDQVPDYLPDPCEP